MKHSIGIIFLLIIICIIPSKSVIAQTDFEKYKQQQQETFQQEVKRQQNLFDGKKKEMQERFEHYRDSLNQVYATFLEERWDSYGLEKPDPLIKDPIPAPPVYDPKREQPKPLEIPIQVVLPVVSPTPPIPDAIPKPVLDLPQEKGVKFVYFGTDVWLKEFPVQRLQLSGVSEKEVSKCWSALSQLPHYEWESDILRIKNELTLNDWGLYQLLNQSFKIYFPQGSKNEQVVFAVFMLNQMGYQAKIGRSGNELMPLIAFQQEVYNGLYFTYGDRRSVKYTVLSPANKNLSSVQTCSIDYANAMNTMDLSVQENPLLAVDLDSKVLTPNRGQDTYELEYNRNRVDFYSEYPCVFYSVHAEAALDEVLLESIEEEILPVISGKSQEEAVNWLLHFVQNAFDYKTDFDQFGYEKWFFLEETIASSYSDCEDRSILFAQLVHRLLGMKVVLIHYPNVHLATAVKFNNPQTKGDYVTVDGEEYLICDPTYVNARLGMAMPELNNMKVEIVKLK